MLLYYFKEAHHAPFIKHINVSNNDTLCGVRRIIIDYLRDTDEFSTTTIGIYLETKSTDYSEVCNVETIKLEELCERLGIFPMPIYNLVNTLRNNASKTSQSVYVDFEIY